MGRQLALWSHLNLAEGIAKVNGSSTLPIRLERDVEREIYKFGNTRCTGMLDFLGVSKVSVLENPTSWVARSGALPWLQVGMAARFADGTNVLERVMSAEFNPRHEVWFSTETRSQIPWTHPVEGRITRSEIHANEITASVDMAGPGLMTIAQSFSPHWRARVNGKRVDVLRANHAFQAVPIPAGLSRVEVRYVDPWFRAGLAITLGTALGLGILAVQRKPSIAVIHGGRPQRVELEGTAHDRLVA